MPDSNPMPPLVAQSSSIAVVLISKGRPEILDDTIDSVLAQTLQPTQILVVVPTERDLPGRERAGATQKIVGPLGICVQRNAAIDAIPVTTDFVAFFDDDFELRADYLKRAISFFEERPDVVAFSGQLLSDGGLTRDEAKKLISNYQPQATTEKSFRSEGKAYILHGCNMIMRRAVLSEERFDENLPLYAYGEDYEMTMRVERHGRVGKFGGCLGVHLETPGGRVREVQRGYSLVANNWYFVKKGSIHLSPLMAWVRFWLVCVGKTFLICAWNFVKRDPSKDWGGRTKGVLLAVADIPRGRCHPNRIRDL